MFTEWTTLMPVAVGTFAALAAYAAGAPSRRTVRAPVRSGRRAPYHADRRRS